MMPTSEPTAFAFCDILGFRERMNTATDLEDLSAMCATVLAPSPSEVVRRSLRYRVFGDSLFLFVSDLHVEQQVVELVTYFQGLLARSITKGLPIRGAISLGRFQWDETFVLGPAVSEAVETAERQEWVGVVAAPSVSVMLAKPEMRSLSAKLSGALSIYQVPVKPDGHTWRAAVVKPEGTPETWASDLIPAIERMLMSSARVDVQRKYANTLAFLRATA